MKITFNNHKYQRIFWSTHTILKDLGFEIKYSFLNSGIISSSQNRGLNIKLLDIRLNKNEEDIELIIFAGQLSGFYIETDMDSEKAFSERLHEHLNKAELNAFSLSDSNSFQM